MTSPWPFTTASMRGERSVCSGRIEACQPPATTGRSGQRAFTARATSTPCVIIGPVTMLMPRQIAPSHAETTSATQFGLTAESTIRTS